MRFIIYNHFTKVVGKDQPAFSIIKDALSYRTKPEFRHNKFFRAKEKLLFTRPDFGICFPTGLLHDTLTILKNNGIALEIEDKRKKPESNCQFHWSGQFEFYDYQKEAIALAKKHGRMIIHLPVRSGKTVIAAGITSALEVRTIYLVHSKIALKQAASTFASSFGRGAVSVHGSGSHSVGPITISTVQSIHKNSNLARKLDWFDLMIVDECHHLIAPTIRTKVIKADCYYKIGLSATAFVSPRRESEQSAIWLKAATGPIRYRISHPELASKGHVMMPKIYMVPVEMEENKSWRGTADDILTNPDRNQKIINALIISAKLGRPAAVVTSRLSQMKVLTKMAKKAGVEAETIHGGTSLGRRTYLIKKLEEGTVDAIIGTVINEAVNIPCLEIVVIAEGLKSRIRSIQRLRNLTSKEGKRKPVVFDFFDTGNKWLENHSNARKFAYEKAGFTVEVKEVI